MPLDLRAMMKVIKLRHYFMVLSSFILFFSLISFFNIGLNRSDLITGAVLFFFSSIIFWYLTAVVELWFEKEKTDTQLDLAIFSLFIIWIVLLVASFYWFIISA